MSPYCTIIPIAIYFGVLVGISKLTAGKKDNQTFFKANKKAPWYLVAFGMVGVSLSGLTFISVPGAVESNSFSYLQMVMGNVVGYWLIMWVLLPLYYKMNLTSIYSYLGSRYGKRSQKTGSFFFLLSRVIGASLRLYLVALVLRPLIFAPLNIPFAVTVAITIALVWLYTHKGGIKTIVWTDTLQTFFLLAAMLVFVFWLSGQLNGFGAAFDQLSEQNLSQVFFWEVNDGRQFFRSFLTGILMTLVMNGLDQDMMQKNLTCRSLKEANKNMFSLSLIFFIVNALFLFLGGFLTLYAQQKGIDAKGDELFGAVAQQASGFFYVMFILGVIAATYSSADSALTSLTTAFCVDFLAIEKRPTDQQIALRKKAHIGFSVVLFVVILIFGSLNNRGLIFLLFTAAGFTYGPLLGMYAFGLFTRKKVSDLFVPVIAVLSPVVAYLIKENAVSLFGTRLTFEILLINGAMTFIALFLMSKGNVEEDT
ncbi:sodium:solute symporter [Candidatus Sororendozoicomonas aggregata]|uniref:sodium:solute symporter n=1 Tax=Candidatus Sororendozoicomonas aggregata TaxID=3073239 RepID=UPI002ED1A7CF